MLAARERKPFSAEAWPMPVLRSMLTKCCCSLDCTYGTRLGREAKQEKNNNNNNILIMYLGFSKNVPHTGAVWSIPSRPYKKIHTMECTEEPEGNESLTMKLSHNSKPQQQKLKLVL